MSDRERIPRTLSWPRQSTAGIVAVIVVAAAAIFAVDLFLPLGVAGGVPYVALVLLGLWLPSRRYILVLACVGTALTVIGYLLSPTGGIAWVVLANRGLALFAIWIVAILLLRHKRAEEALPDISQITFSSEQIVDHHYHPWKEFCSAANRQFR
ncbi:MAG: hypothetical protein QF666_05565, partial [Alphaproteobacteria bacterium]|nr:hypothetical protein [Alphaproteobacteria bacterium]